MADITILVVDDESRMRKLVKDFLKVKGYHILEAGDGEEALQVFEENKNEINLILLDVMMPKLDGWSVLRQIRQTSNVPIIMLTARGEEQDELFGFELGVDEYISKPFSPKILVARVEAILKRLQVKEKDIKDYGGIIINSEGRTVEVDSKKVDLSLREYELLKYLGASLEDTFAFGDAKVDIPMLEYCNVGVAANSGGDEIKAMADYVTDDVDKDGIYKAFVHFGLIDDVLNLC